jgi:hypothetical protein
LSRRNKEENYSRRNNKITYRRGQIHSGVLLDLERSNTRILQDFAKVSQDLLLCQLLRRNHPGWVFRSGILKAIPLPRLQRLHSATKETGHDTKASQALLLQDPDLLKERLDLLEVF